MIQELPLKSVVELPQVWLKADKDVSQFTLNPKYVANDLNLTEPMFL